MTPITKEIESRNNLARNLRIWLHFLTRNHLCPFNQKSFFYQLVHNIANQNFCFAFGCGKLFLTLFDVHEWSSRHLGIKKRCATLPLRYLRTLQLPLNSQGSYFVQSRVHWVHCFLSSWAQSNLQRVPSLLWLLWVLPLCLLKPKDSSTQTST